jgi:hypothetical protein
LLSTDLLIHRKTFWLIFCAMQCSRRNAVQQMMDLFNQGLAIGNHLTVVTNMLEKIDAGQT